MNPTLYPTRTLAIHPAVKHLPMLPEESPEFAAMVNSIDDVGILEPLKLHKGRVVDGRDRLRAAMKTGRDQVPGVEICEGDLHTVILASLLVRKHYSKSALAYLSFPHVEPVLKEAQARKMAFLKSGGREHSSLSERCSAPNGDEARRQLSGLRGAQSAEEIGDALGIGRTSLFAARNIHGHFRKNAELQAHFEPRILSGEMGLGAVLQGIAGWNATKGQPKAEREQLLLWDEKIKGFGDARKFAGWNEAPEEVKEHVKAEMLKAITTVWPADLVESVLGQLGNR